MSVGQLVRERDALRKALGETREALLEIVANAHLAPPGDVFAREVLQSRGAAICKQIRDAFDSVGKQETQP